tara:strand:+ start:204 stop:395 length:192 start_codon:yes stop_codon:yes gene_type:complete
MKKEKIHIPKPKAKKLIKVRSSDLDPNKLIVEHYKSPRIKSTYFLLGLVIGYLPYVIHKGWLF